MNPWQIRLWDSLVDRQITDSKELYRVSAPADRALREFSDMDIRLKPAEETAKRLISQRREQAKEEQMKQQHQQHQQESYIDQIRTQNDRIRQLLDENREIRKREDMHVRQIGEMNERQGKYIQEIRVLDDWVRQLFEDVEAVFLSFRWRIGSCVVRIAERLMSRGQADTVREHVGSISETYRSWRADRSTRNVLERK